MWTAVHFWSLTAIAAASGIAMLPAFRRFSDQERIRLAKRKIWAHLYEFRLFADDPALLVRAQKGLLRWNARYLGLMLRPTAVVLLPMAALLFYLDGVYGHRPLRSGESATVSAKIEGVDLRQVLPTLSGDGVTVETPAVRIPERHQVYWRVRATNPAGGALLLRVAGQSLHQRVRVGAGLQYLAEWRNLQVSYPSANLDIFGFGVHWLGWFFIVSSIAMLALRKRFHVTF